MTPTRAQPRCPADEALAGFVAGELPADHLSTLEAHLDHCATCRRTVSALAAIATPRGRPRATDTLAATALPSGLDDGAAAALAPGDRLGRFEITRPLGHGAMGEVWAARDPALDREVALKLLRVHPDALGDEAAARLRREAQAMARLNHPNVVSIYELGADGARAFCAMELVDGITLRGWLVRRRPWPEVLAVALAIGRGLAAAHAAGLIHRDVKPENVLLSRDGRTLVTDFGLAKLASSLDDRAAPALALETSAELAATEPGAPPGLTATGVLVGTPAYMAPEQLAGGGGDALGDQFAYCVTVYEAICGARPFAGATLAELAASIRAGAPRIAAPPGVPRRVLAALVRGLAPDPRARWPSMDALLGELTRATTRRRRGWIAAGALVVAAAAVTGGVVLARDDRPRDAEVRVAAESRISRAWNPTRRDELRAAFAAHPGATTTDRADAAIRGLDAYRAAWLTGRLEAWGATHLRGEQTLARLELRLACFDRLADALDAVVGLLREPSAAEVARAPDMVGRLEPVAACGDASRFAGESDAPSTPAGQALERDLRQLEALQVVGRHAEALHRAEAAVGQADAAGTARQRARARYDLGIAHANAGDPAAAEPTLRRALQDAAAARDHALVAAIWLRLSALVAFELRRPGAAEELQPAVRAAVAQAGDDPRQLAELAYAIGLAAVARGDYAAARTQLTEARTRRIAIYGPAHPQVAHIESALGGIHMHLGDLAEASRLLDHATEIARASLGALHPLVVQIEQNRAAVANRRGDPAAAERHLTAALVVAVAVRGEVHPEVGKLHLLRARAQQAQKSPPKLAEAAAELDRARASYAATPATSPDRIKVELGAAQIAEARGDYPAAERLASAAVTTLRASTAGVVDRAHGLAELARITAYRSPRAALPLYDEALTAHTSRPSRDASGDRETLEELARVALAAGRPAAALRWFDRMPEAAAQLPAVRARLARLAGRK